MPLLECKRGRPMHNKTNLRQKSQQADATISSSYDDSCEVFSCVYGSPFYDAFSFYRLACLIDILNFYINLVHTQPERIS